MGRVGRVDVVEIEISLACNKGAIGAAIARGVGEAVARAARDEAVENRLGVEELHIEIGGGIKRKSHLPKASVEKIGGLACKRCQRREIAADEPRDCSKIGQARDDGRRDTETFEPGDPGSDGTHGAGDCCAHSSVDGVNAGGRERVQRPVLDLPDDRVRGAQQVVAAEPNDRRGRVANGRCDRFEQGDLFVEIQRVQWCHVGIVTRGVRAGLSKVVAWIAGLGGRAKLRGYPSVFFVV